MAYTPYLIVDDAMIQALCLAAKRGVDVRIVTPGIPDKKFAYWLTQSNYSALISGRCADFTIHAGIYPCEVFFE